MKLVEKWWANIEHIAFGYCQGALEDQAILVFSGVHNLACVLIEEFYTVVSDGATQRPLKDLWKGHSYQIH